MNEILRRRRALIANPWVDVTHIYPLSAFVGSGVFVTVTYSQNYTVMTATTTGSAGTYRNAVNPFVTENGYRYKITCNVNPTGGPCRIRGRTAEGTIIASITQEYIENQRDISIKFDHNPNLAVIALFITWASSTTGAGTITQWKVERQKI